MDRLSIVLTLAVGPVVTGALIIAVMSFGWLSWPAIGGAAAIGFLATWPLSYLVSRRIKRQDPQWDETRIGEAKSAPLDLDAPEV